MKDLLGNEIKTGDILLELNRGYRGYGKKTKYV